MEAVLPDWPQALTALDTALPDWVGTTVYLGVVAFLTLFVHSVLMTLAHWLLDGRFGELGLNVLSRISAPTRFGLVVLVLGGAAQFTSVEGGRPLVQWALLILFIIFLGWTIITVINAAAEIYLHRVPHEADDAIAARKHLTQVQLLRRIAVFGVAFLTFSAVLMTIPAVREYGVSLLASAGVAGLVIGLAARPVLSNLIAGVQLATTQPIRLGDEVVVEGEFGTVEEIRTSYVVLRLWDLRRLLVPLSYFMERPFQNWTRESTSIIGSVFWYVDYTVPIQAMRETFMELIHASRLWDGQTAALQMTEVSQESVQVRGIMSAASSGAAFNLRCEVREKMVAWLQENYPEALPRVRAYASHELIGVAAAGDRVRKHRKH